VYMFVSRFSECAWFSVPISSERYDESSGADDAGQSAVVEGTEISDLCFLDGSYDT